MAIFWPSVWTKHNLGYFANWFPHVPGRCLPLVETDALAENWNQAGITQAWSAFGNAGKIGVFNDQSHLSSTAGAERLPLNNIEPCLFFRPRDRQQNTSYVRFHNQSILVKFNSLNAAAIWRFFHRRPVFVAMADSQQPRGNKKNKRNHKKIQKRRKKNIHEDKDSFFTGDHIEQPRRPPVAHWRCGRHRGRVAGPSCLLQTRPPCTFAHCTWTDGEKTLPKVQRTKGIEYSDSFNNTQQKLHKLWNLGQTSASFCLATVEK